MQFGRRRAKIDRGIIIQHKKKQWQLKLVMRVAILLGVLVVMTYLRNRFMVG